MKQKKYIIPPAFGIDPFFCIDPTGHITAINHAAEKITGISNGNLTGNSFAGLFKEPAKAAEMLNLALENGMVSNYSLSLFSGNGGKETNVIFNAFCNTDESGKADKVFAIAVQQNEAGEENYKKVIREIADYKYALDESSIVAITDQKGIIQHANDNFCKISKYSRDELIGQDHRIINSGYHPKDFIKNLWTTIAKGKIWRGEFCNRKKDGELYWVDTTIIPFLDTESKPYQYLSIRIDITDKKLAAEELRKSEIRLKEAQVIANIGNWEIDLVQNVHIWSDEVYRIYGLAKAETTPSIGLFISSLHPDDKGTAQDLINEALQNFRDSKINFRFIHSDNNLKYGIIEWRFEFDKKGNPSRLYGIVQDITERKEAEENLKLLEQKILKQKIQEQKKVARAMITSQEKERNYIGQELHDNINQILAGTKMFLGVAGKKNETVKELVKYPMELLDTSIEEIRLLSSKLVTPLKNINLKDLIKTLMSKTDQNEMTKTTFTYIVPGELLSDDLKLNIYRIIQEQVNNIFKYAEAKNVIIAVEAKGKNIYIAVEDDGKGFDVSSKRKGIGISNMINRVETFNGNMKIKSNPGNGCKISITIPF